jgi:hypothetical protein
MSIWKHKENENFGLANKISKQISLWEWANPNLLIDVRQSTELLVACDIGGSHKGSTYESFSFLIGAINFGAEWESLQKNIRKTLLPDGRRMSYKSLGDAIRAKSLVPFLKAANEYRGVLVTFLIDKKISNLIGEPKDKNVFPELIIAKRGWNKKVFHRLCLTATLGSLLVSGLSKNEQDILWLIDQDEIAANEKKHDEAGQVIHHHTEVYAPQNHGLLAFITTEADFDNRKFEDIVAIPDLVCGALAEAVTNIRNLGHKFGSPILIPLSTDFFSKKAKIILDWYSEKKTNLKKLAIVLELKDKNVNIECFSPFNLSRSISFNLTMENLEPKIHQESRDNFIINLI